VGLHDEMGRVELTFKFGYVICEFVSIFSLQDSVGSATYVSNVFLDRGSVSGPACSIPRRKSYKEPRMRLRLTTVRNYYGHTCNLYCF
jgi:hypothetical protein